MSKTLVSTVMCAAILGASAVAGAQTAPSSQTAPSQKQGETVSQTTTQNQIDFKVMDINSDGMISRDEYVKYYGGRFDRMKRNDKGMVMMQDVRMWDDRNNPTSDTPSKNRPGVKGGAGSPPATGGGSN